MINIRELLGFSPRQGMWCLICPSCGSFELYTKVKPNGDYLDQTSTFLPSGRRMGPGAVGCKRCNCPLDTQHGTWREPSHCIEQALEILHTLSLSGMPVSDAELDIALTQRGL